MGKKGQIGFTVAWIGTALIFAVLAVLELLYGPKPKDLPVNSPNSPVEDSTRPFAGNPASGTKTDNPEALAKDRPLPSLDVNGRTDTPRGVKTNKTKQE